MSASDELTRPELVSETDRVMDDMRRMRGTAAMALSLVSILMALTGIFLLLLTPYVNGGIDDGASGVLMTMHGTFVLMSLGASVLTLLGAAIVWRLMRPDRDWALAVAMSRLEARSGGEGELMRGGERQ